MATLSTPFPVAASEPKSINPWLIAITVTLATFMELLDTAIANVSLPHIAGRLATSYDESTWVLTSYLVANAIVLPLSAWLSRVFGRKNCSSSGQVEQARADVHAALLNLSYTRIYAPVSGIIGRKTVEVGQRIQPGQSLLAIVPVDDIWVTANFKETQLQRMRTGQSVTIHVDSFDHDYSGTVENLTGAAGTLFSLLPPENANGNFVKVVQRMPVRIRFRPGEDPEHLLRPGMSAESTVKVR
jgi:multidrug efflux pump subunit AcrA (membrane-fusion protein)